MFLPRVTYDTVVAYLLGIDDACNREFLKGFQEWIVPIVNNGSSQAWTEKVLRIAFPKSIDPRSELLKESNITIAIECLFQCLEDFLTEKQKDHGIDLIIQRYQDWLSSWIRS